MRGVDECSTQQTMANGCQGPDSEKLPRRGKRTRVRKRVEMEKNSRQWADRSERARWDDRKKQEGREKENNIYIKKTDHERGGKIKTLGNKKGRAGGPWPIVFYGAPHCAGRLSPYHSTYLIPLTQIAPISKT